MNVRRIFQDRVIELTNQYLAAKFELESNGNSSFTRSLTEKVENKKAALDYNSNLLKTLVAIEEQRHTQIKGLVNV